VHCFPKVENDMAGKTCADLAGRAQVWREASMENLFRALRNGTGLQAGGLEQEWMLWHAGSER